MLGFQKPLVAVVDDVASKLVLARLWLEYMGCRAQVFERGADFLANADRETACVILNQRMPGMDGHEVYRQMRGAGWDIPVISESAYMTEEALWAAYRGGQVAHLTCPWNDTEFEDAIRTGLLAAGFCLPPKGVNAFDPMLLDWNSGLIPALAHSISQDGAFDLLPVLGDALEEAGCGNADGLAHCRTPGEHRRGCWVLDRVYALALPDFWFETSTCPNCEQRLRVANNLGPLTVRCAGCGEHFEWTRSLSLLFVS
jgi:CheY-like chemotaxis protein